MFGLDRYDAMLHFSPYIRVKLALLLIYLPVREYQELYRIFFPLKLMIQDQVLQHKQVNLFAVLKHNSFPSSTQFIYSPNLSRLDPLYVGYGDRTTYLEL
jgi:hypothetical protein